MPSGPRLMEVAELRDMEMVKGLPLVVVIEIGNRTSFYQIDEPHQYWSEFPGNSVREIAIKDAEAVCRKYGKPITEEQFSKAAVAPGFIRDSPNGSYHEYRAKFQ